MDKQFFKDVFQAHFFFGPERRQKGGLNGRLWPERRGLNDWA
jgi:hypothetical protein